MSEVIKITLSEDFKKTAQQILAAETKKFSELSKIAGLSLAEDFVGIDLSGEDLSDDTLMGVNFRDASLSNANFSGTDLSHANLMGADLSGANLSSANLSQANLDNTNLRDADLRYCTLNHTTFSNAHVQNVQLQENPGISEDTKFDLKKRGAMFLEEDLELPNNDKVINLKPQKNWPKVSFENADLRASYLAGSTAVTLQKYPFFIDVSHLKKNERLEFKYDQDKNLIAVQKVTVSLFKQRMEARAVTEIEPNVLGTVMYQGSYWKARCDSNVRIEAGQKVLVIGRYELTLLVTPLSHKSGDIVLNN